MIFVPRIFRYVYLPESYNECSQRCLLLSGTVLSLWGAAPPSLLFAGVTMKIYLFCLFIYFEKTQVHGFSKVIERGLTLRKLIKLGHSAIDDSHLHVNQRYVIVQ